MQPFLFVARTSKSPVTLSEFRFGHPNYKPKACSGRPDAKNLGKSCRSCKLGENHRFNLYQKLGRYLLWLFSLDHWRSLGASIGMHRNHNSRCLPTAVQILDPGTENFLNGGYFDKSTRAVLRARKKYFTEFRVKWGTLFRWTRRKHRRSRTYDV